MSLTVTSEDLVDKGNQIIQLYNQYLGRDPLQGGLDGWLATGQSIEQIEQGIANSPEAGVFQTFNETVGRDPTMEERDYFVNVNPAPIEVVEGLLSNLPEAKEFQAQQQLDETDLLADTTAGSTLDDTTVDSETETAFPTADTGRFGDMIDASATFANANQYLGVNEAQWSAFVNEVNDIKAQMNAFEGNEARVLQDRSIPDALLDRRIAVLLNQNPGMTADEARAQAEASPEYQDMVATNQQYEALNSRLNELYASVGLDSQGSITGSDMGVEGGIVRFDLQDGGVTFEALGNSMAKGLIIGAAAAIFTGPLATALGPASAGGAGIFSSTTAAKAASSAIISSASQLAATGELDIGQALVSAAMSYGGTQLGDAVKNSGVIGDIASQVESTANSAVDFLSQGNSIAEAAIKAGGMSMLTQLVTTGEVDLEQAAVAAFIAGGAEGINQLAAASGQSVDDLEEITVTATKKGTPVGDSSYMLEDGTVISVGSDGSPLVLGQMSDIDLDGDGLLSSSDLQNIEVTAEKIEVAPKLFTYDSQGNVVGDQDYFSESKRYYINDNGTIYNTADLKYIEGGPGDTLLVRDSDGNQFYVRDARYDAASGSFFDPETNASLGVTSAYDPSTGNVYSAEDVGLGLNQITDVEDGVEFQYGRNPNFTNDESYGGPFMEVAVRLAFRVKQTFIMMPLQIHILQKQIRATFL